MTRFVTRLSAIWQGLLRSFRDFPVEAFISIAAFTLTILSEEEVIASGFPIVFFFPLVVLSFSLHRMAGREGIPAWKVCYLVSALLWIPLYVWKPTLDEAGIFVTYLLSFILLFASVGRHKDNAHYAETILHCLSKGLAAVLVAGILSLALLAITASVDYLFLSSHLGEKWYIYPLLLIWMVIAPMLCCSFVSEPPAQWKDRRFLSIVVDYVLTPALLIYAVILYAYMLRILFQWRLPDGGVAYLVGGFVGVALSCRLLREQLSTRHFNGFYQYLPYVNLGPLVLLWVGVVRRVGEYGLTEMRVYLIAVSLLLTLFTLMLPSPRTRSYYRMSLITGCVAILLTYIPGMRACDLGLYSQRARTDAVQADDGDMERPEVLDDVVPSTCYELEEPVPLNEYTLFIPEGSYHYYEDSSVAIFYEDASREKELLRCEIAARLDSPDAEKLIFRNEQYQAVFTLITDYQTGTGPRFITGQHMLYARP